VKVQLLTSTYLSDDFTVIVIGPSFRSLAMMSVF